MLEDIDGNEVYVPRADVLWFQSCRIGGLEFTTLVTEFGDTTVKGAMRDVAEALAGEPAP